MHSGKSQPPAFVWIKPSERGPDLSCSDICPTDHPHILIKKKVALSLPVADEDVGYGIMISLGKEPSDVQIRQDVHIMDKEWGSLQLFACIKDSPPVSRRKSRSSEKDTFIPKSF